MHIFAYPSIWPETSCIALLEAMSAGLLCVHSAYAALPETASNWTMMYPMTENHQEHCNRFADQLLSAVQMVDQEFIKDRLSMQKRYTNGFYNWDLNDNSDRFWHSGWIGHHAKWVQGEGQYGETCMKLIDKNSQFGAAPNHESYNGLYKTGHNNDEDQPIDLAHRWLGIAQSLPHRMVSQGI